MDCAGRLSMLEEIRLVQVSSAGGLTLLLGSVSTGSASNHAFPVIATASLDSGPWVARILTCDGKGKARAGEDGMRNNACNSSQTAELHYILYTLYCIQYVIYDILYIIPPLNAELRARQS